MPKESELLTQVEPPKAVPPPAQTMEEPKSTGSLAAAMSTSVASQGQSSTTASNTPESAAGQAGTSTTSVAAPKGPNKFKAAGAALIGSQVMTKAAGERGVAREAKKNQMTSVAGNTSAGRDTSDDKSNGDQAVDVVDGAVGVVGDAKDEFGDAYEAVNEAQGKEKDDLSDTVKADMKGVGIVSGAMGALSGIKAMADSLQTIMDPKKDALDKIEAGMSMGEGAAGGVGSAADLTNEVASEGSKAAGDSEAVSAYAGGVGEAISSIKSAFLAIKGIVTLVNERGKSSKKEKAIEGLGVAQSMVESAKSVLSTINGIKEAIDGGTFGGVAAAIPGLDIALAGISIIKEGVYLVIAYKDYKQINADKEAQMAGDGDLADSTEKIRNKESTISNLQTVISEDEKRLAVIVSKIPAASTDKGIFGGDSEKMKLEAEKLEIEGRLATMKGKKALATDEKTALETAKPEALEFAMVGEIAEANKKRIVRNSILLVAEFANLAGSIANLTGAGAVAGAGLKTASAAVKVALPAARAAKQTGRDSAANAEAKGETTMASRVFDASKSTAAKRDYRMKQVNTLLGQIQGLSQLEGPKFDARAAQLEGYISAMGVSPKRLYAATPDQEKQITMLYKALIQRE